ncbi:MAG: ATP-binding cassette domain-containing protein [Pseudoclavibacter sp.]
MLLEAQMVCKTFRARRATGVVKAVADATVTVKPGDFTAIVGESGSGKSTLARMLLGLVPTTSGQVMFDGVDIAAMKKHEQLHYRRSVQAVLQDPAGSLNPRKTVERSIAEVIRFHGIARGSAVRDKVLESLELVGMTPARRFIGRYPHELSGGQRQRVLIAKAIVLDPKIIVADEAVSALDASVKAGILDLLEELRVQFGIGYVFITHDLSVVKKVAERVIVMKSGLIVEEGTKTQIFAAPRHAYTKQLLAASPRLDTRRTPATDTNRSAHTGRNGKR